MTREVRRKAERTNGWGGGGVTYISVCGDDVPVNRVTTVNFSES